jgi:WD40 repeat protein/Ca2+-binding EF-hand superfamily protein
MGQALSRGKASTFPPLLVETQIFTLWTIQDVRELQKLVRNTINGYWVVEIQFESLLQNFKNVTDYITLEKLFAVLDNDFDGRIDCLELIGGIALVCSATFEEKVKFCFEYYDFNYNGTLSSKEMVIMMILSVCGLNVLAGGNEENEPDIAVFERLAEDAFNRADRDRSNQISYNEFVSWARSNRELMAGLEGLQQVTREARSRIEDEDSASEISEGECYHENEMTPETSAIHDQPLPPPVSTIQYPDKWRKQIHEPTKCFTKNSMDEGYTNLRLTTAVGVSAAALYIKSDHSISNEDAASSYIAYPSATLVILQNTSTYEQSFYCKHTSQVVCLSSCSKGITFASADTLGDIHIWQPWSLVQTQRVIHSPQKLSRVCISPAADAVIVVGRDFDNTLTLYDIRSGDMSGTAKGIPSPGQTHDLCFSPSGSELVVVGTKYILFLTIAKNGSLEKSNGRIGKLGKQQTFFSAAYISAFEAAVGCSNGDVYLFKDFTCCQVVQAHSNKSAVLSLLYNTLQNILVSGGSDGVVKTWDSTLQPVGDAVDVTDLDDDAHLPKGSEIISLSARDGAILVTTKGHDILEIIFATSKATHSIKRLLHGHSDGIYGLTCHPLCDDFITTSDDKTLRLWRLNGDSCIMVSFRATPERAHAVCYSPTGDTLCVGMVDGSVALLDASLRVFCKWKHTRATITDVIFSAIGKVLIMGAADGNIYVYLAEDKKSFVRHTICRGHGSPVLSVDVSMHSNFIMANYADGSLQYWDSNGILIVDSYPLCDMKWYGNHTIFGWSTQVCVRY